MESNKIELYRSEWLKQKNNLPDTFFIIEDKDRQLWDEFVRSLNYSTSEESFLRDKAD
jgi:hypothetical protein